MFFCVPLLENNISRKKNFLIEELYLLSFRTTVYLNHFLNSKRTLHPSNSSQIRKVEDRKGEKGRHISGDDGFCAL